ncbi:SCO2583 family membrane protein [Streptomyces xiamenensis]|uniref:SCO2583 family membrane protein n=1 Tax=Streptomyces xiamenensis TaxID=408015 RepID=UPI0037CF0EB6
MAGSSDPGGVPGSGDEEYASTVFDESFVNAARLQEFSAQERLEDHSTAVRDRKPERTVPRQGLALGVIILLAFAAAVYLGNNNPYGEDGGHAVQPPLTTLVPLAPAGVVPGAAEPAELFEASPAQGFGSGAAGVLLPDARATAHFSRDQVFTALTLAKEYIVASALTQDVLTGVSAVPVRELLDPQQRRQLDRAVSGGIAAAPLTAWLVSFDPLEVELADPQVRIEGTFAFTEIADDMLQVTARHVAVYAVREAGAAPREPGEEPGETTLFTVRREVVMLFAEEGLQERTVILRQTDLLAGPMDCGVDPDGPLRPLLAGERAGDSRPAGTDPYTTDADHIPLCGALDAKALPNPDSAARDL